MVSPYYIYKSRDLESGLQRKPPPVSEISPADGKGENIPCAEHEARQVNRNEGLQIENYRQGYPRFSALMAADSSFRIYRRFSFVRARLLLYAQDKVVELEEKLNEIDRNETHVRYLSTNMMDRNSERQEVICKLDEALKSYDELLERNRQIEGYHYPKAPHVQSLLNWLDGNVSIARSESEFLHRDEDLLVCSNSTDSAIASLDEFVSSVLARFGKRSKNAVSRDPHVHIPPRIWAKRAARLILIPCIIILLLAPVVICNSVISPNIRLATIVLTTSLFITTLALWTGAQTVELVVAGSTYTTVLIVFISGRN